VAADNARTGADTAPGTGLLHDAEAELYAGDPAGFIRRRGELAAQARASGDGAAAKAIAGLRKPTRSAWAVNRLVRTDPDVSSRLTALGDDLRDAGRSLDGRRLRELSLARRDLIAELTRRALAGAGQHDAPDALRDEVTATFGAAVSDPAVASELAAGSLVRPVERAGFGFGTDTGPGEAPPRAQRAERPSPAARPGKNAAERRRAEREQAERERAERARAAQERAEREWRDALAAAERTLGAAVQAAEDAQTSERTYEDAVRDLEQQLDDAHGRLAGAKRTSRAAAAALRDARRALDRLRRRRPA
jgi:hypothetical protein